MVSVGSRVLVTIVFVVLGAAFLLETGVLMYEYWQDGVWFQLASFDTQNFIFFPIAGVAALFVFWRPATVVVDAYMKNVIPMGRIIFFMGCVVIIVGAAFLARSFTVGGNPSFFEVAPEVLVADDGDAMDFQNPYRAPVLTVLGELRFQASATGLAPFHQSCRQDSVSVTQTEEATPYCFVSGARMSVDQCCRAKARFREAINAMHAQGGSLTSSVHRWVMPLKIFFLLMLVGVGVMLIRRRARMYHAYERECDKFSRAVPIGAALMLLWPLMNGAYTQSYDIVFGDAAVGAFRGAASLYTLGFAGWALMLLFYHLRTYPQTMEYAAQMIGLAAAAVGVMRYDQLISYINANIGVGATGVSLAVFAVASMFLVWMFTSHDEEIKKTNLAATGDPEPS